MPGGVGPGGAGLASASRGAAGLGKGAKHNSEGLMYNDDVALEELQRRALTAYFETGGDVMPSEPRMHKIKGKRYVSLWRRGKMLVCYRVRNDGKLKRLVRVPEGLQ